MMVIIVAVELPEKDAQAIKEALAMDCEKYGRGGQSPRSKRNQRGAGET